MIQSTIISERPNDEPVTLYTLLKSTILSTYGTDCDEEDFHKRMQGYVRPFLGKPFLAIVQEGSFSSGITPGRVYNPTRTELRLGSLCAGMWVATTAGVNVTSGVEVRIPMKEYGMMLDMSCRSREYDQMVSRVWSKKEGNLLLNNEDLSTTKIVQDPSVVPPRYVSLIAGERNIVSLIGENHMGLHFGMPDYLSAARMLGWGIENGTKKQLIRDLFECEKNPTDNFAYQVASCLEFKVHELQEPVQVRTGVQVLPQEYLTHLATKYDVEIPVEKVLRPKRG